MAECSVENIGNDELPEVTRRQRIIDRAPFQKLKIKDVRILDTIKDRQICKLCYKSRKFFCYTCCLPVIDRSYFPRVKLPIKIDIIKHVHEIDGKSTAIHAAILAPEDVKIYTYPDFPEILNKEETVLIFPSNNATTVDALFTKGEKDDDSARPTAFPIKRAIFIDSTWHQTKAIYKDQRLRELRCVILKSRISQFWRHQKKSPRWYLATIEAIHQFLIELHTCALGTVEEYANLNNSVSNGGQNSVTNEEETEYEELNQKYNGQYDNLLYFFKYMYDKIHSMYDHNKLQAYKRPLT
ncbi:tRNA-uridine aminocarboxypropyltransferase 1 [Linepithema humile]|uniref:tRNA-uridine aminocarboxypropyltransferase 1 n=1 Tax=Linepithema humile TaxID=83485 RepID=UPI000623637C|nr:PREDICTED: DTW domain-containing protein 1 [Linepithema humile]